MKRHAKTSLEHAKIICSGCFCRCCIFTCGCRKASGPAWLPESCEFGGEADETRLGWCRVERKRGTQGKVLNMVMINKYLQKQLGFESSD